MDEFIKLLSSDYELLRYKFTDSLIVFEVISTKQSVCCPYCGTPSTKVHSTYQREIQDLPIQNKQFILLVNTRKMFCRNPDCSYRTFSEKHSFVVRSGKKTERLIANILNTSLKLSSVNASKLLESESIKVCKSSICNLLKKNT